METKKEPLAAVVEELAFEPRAPGETTAEAFNKSMDASNFKPLTPEQQEQKALEQTAKPAVDRTKVVQQKAQVAKVQREINKLRQGGPKFTPKKLAKKLAKQQEKARRKGK